MRHHGRVPEPSFPAPPDPSHPDLVRVPGGPVTRFAPAPTGDLHLGHLVNALYTWGIARATGGRVILRIEDHDRQRSRATFEAGLLDDLERLGLTPDEPPITAFRAGPTPYRQSDCGPTYAAAAERLRVAGLVYACRCSRATFAAWEAAHGVPWDGPGCPGGCRARADGDPATDADPGAAADPAAGSTVLRVALGDGVEGWSVGDQCTALLAGGLAVLVPVGRHYDAQVREDVTLTCPGLHVIIVIDNQPNRHPNTFASRKIR